MSDETNNVGGGQGGNQNNFDPNRPRMKKIKRPVRRILPADGAEATNEKESTGFNRPVGGSSMPLPPRAQTFQPQNEDEEDEKVSDSSLNPIKLMGPEDEDEDNFNLDDILDEETNLPTTLNKGFDNKKPSFIDDSDIEEVSGKTPFIVNGMFSKKAVGIVAAATLLIGFLLGKMMFSSETIVRDGLQGVVLNAEVPRGRARCGVAEKTQGCILYIMNPQRQELNARDFYDLASQLTGRQRFLIETANMRYSSVKIRPGEIAQLNIPPLQ